MKRLFKTTLEGAGVKYFESLQDAKGYLKESRFTLPIRRGPDHIKGEQDTEGCK